MKYYSLARSSIFQYDRLDITRVVGKISGLDGLTALNFCIIGKWAIMGHFSLNGDGKNSAPSLI